MKKLSLIVLLFGGIFISSIFASTSGTSLSLSEQLQLHKNTLETQITNMETKFHSEYDRLIAPEKLTANYQSLVCLGVIQEDDIMTEMENKLSLLKKSMLEDYVDLNADIFNLLNQYSVWLIGDTVYRSQYEKYIFDLNSFFNTHKTLIEKTDKEYLQKIFSFLEKNKQYSNNNWDLLTSLNSKILKIQTSLNQFQTLEEGIFEINNALNMHKWNFLDTLESARNTIVTMLDQDLTKQISRYDRRFTNDPQLQNIYLAKKHETINGFTIALDNEIENILGSRYDQADYSYAKEQIGVIKSTFYEENTLKCEKVITTNIDLDGYIDDLESTIKKLRNDVSTALITLSNTWSTNNSKLELLSSFKRFYTVHYNTELNQFKDFVRTRTSSNSQLPIDNWQSSQVAIASTQAQDSIIAYIFTSPFTKWEQSEGIKHLQILLQKLWHYKYEINSIFDANTAEAVYNFQLAKWILKWLPWETAQWFVGPSTRAVLNEEMKKYANTIQAVEKEITPEVQKPQAKVEYTNPFLWLLYKMEAKYGSKEWFVTLMQKARISVSEKIKDDTLPVQQKMTLETIKEAVDLYLK